MDQLQPQLQPQPPLQPSGLPTGPALSGQPKSSFSFIKSKIAPLLAVLTLLVVAGAVTYFVINQRKPAPVSSSQASSAASPITGDFSISIATDKTELGPSEKATITIIVTSIDGFSNKVKLTPVLDPNWMMPDVGFGNFTMLNRNVTPLPNQTADAVLDLQTVQKLPDLKEGSSSAKSFQVKGESQGVVRESNILMLKTKTAK